jgi:predicted phosphoadenosine phosphosulfate sulfurtransferase
MLGSDGMRQKLHDYVTTWMARGYPEGIPDEADPVLESYNKAPSYRAICRAIMKNDVMLQSLGYAREECPAYTALKRAELIARGVIVPTYEPIQLDLPFGGIA